jgi:predicted nucleotidyltransferase component of viral defense system
MERFLAQTASDQRLAFEQTGARRSLPAASVEKDFWACWVLRALFRLPSLADRLTFKGGTSLSKAWGLIERFSEDLDLTIHRELLGFGGTAGPERAGTRSQRAARMKRLVNACAAHVARHVLPELAAEAERAVAERSAEARVDPDDSDGQTVLFQYPTLFPAAEARYLRPVVKIEFGARSDPSPSEARRVHAFVAEAFPQTFDRPDFVVMALSPLRTFWEKAMLLHEENARPFDKPRGPRMARHYYDVFQLIHQGVAREAAADGELFARVAEHRRIFFPQNWVDYGTLRRGSLRITPAPDREAEWRIDYGAMQTEMFSSPPPAFEVILAAIRVFEDEFNKGRGA